MGESSNTIKQSIEDVCRFSMLSVQSHHYHDLVRRRCAPAAQQWWNDVLGMFVSPFPRERFAKTYSRSARMLGYACVESDQQDSDTIPEAALSVFEGRALHEVGRMVLLLCASELIALDQQGEWIDELYVCGDSAEREALLRSLSLLPDPRPVLPTAIEACRSNVQTVFEAMVCENPFPAQYFPSLNFDQMVMKAIFTRVSLKRIVALSSRVTPKLSRMAQDYVHERKAAGRAVPEDIGLLLNG